MDTIKNNKRIAKNTLLLYLRHIVVMLVSLYTSRVTLDVLGVTDYGVYNVVGGIVVLFSFLYQALSIATQRYLSFYMGKNDYRQVRKVFCLSINIYAILSIIIIAVAESVGLWFFSTKLNIPEDRVKIAFWVYQISIISCVVNVFRIPYNSSIIAYEKMSFFAYLSVFEVVFKLILVYLLYVFAFDKLLVYALLLFVLQLIILFIYKIYCNSKFESTKYMFIWDRDLFKQLLSFSGWTMFGSGSNIAANQGLAFLLNIFAGVVANAALGISNQIDAAVNSFVSSFQTAFKPQLVKSYAEENFDYFFSLIFKTSRFSYYLILVMAIPIIVFCNDILSAWLVVVPEYAVSFARLMLVFFMIDALSGPLWYSVQATGDIRNYQILMSVCILSNLPLSYLVLKFGFSPVYCILIRVLINFVIHFIRIFYLRGLMRFPSIKYIMDVMCPVFFITLLSIVAPLLLYKENLSLVQLLLRLFLSVVYIFFVIWIFGLKKSERIFLLDMVRKKFKRT